MTNQQTKTEEINSHMEESLKSIESKFFNENFNVLDELINIFSDSKQDTIKFEMEKLEKLDGSIEEIMKRLAKHHSSEFFKILSYVRQILQNNEKFKSQISEGNEILLQIKDMTRLLTESNTSVWKLRSTYFSEIILKLNKIKYILKILGDCENFIDNGKLFETVLIMKKSLLEQKNFDSAFRQFNFCTIVNEKFRNIKGIVSKKLFCLYEKKVLYEDKDYLYTKIDCLCNEFYKDYINLSIDIEVHIPFLKNLFLIDQVCFELLSKKESDFNIQYENIDDLHYKMMRIDSEHKSNSLVYFLNCLFTYDERHEFISRLPLYINQKSNSLFEDIVNLVHDKIENITFNQLDYEKNMGKEEKVKVIMFFNTILTCVYSVYIKVSGMMWFFSKKLGSFNSNSNTSDTTTDDISNVSYVIHKLENMIMSLYIQYSRICLNNPLVSFNITDNEVINGIPFDLSYKIRRVSELPSSLNLLSISIKIYYNLIVFSKKSSSFLYKISQFSNSSKLLLEINRELYSQLSETIIPNRFINILSWMNEYDNETASFKFINEMRNKLNSLKNVFNFRLDNSFEGVFSIINGIFSKFNEDIDYLVSDIKKTVAYNEILSSIYQVFSKYNEYFHIELKHISMFPMNKSPNKSRQVGNSTGTDSISSSTYEFNKVMSRFIFTKANSDNDSSNLSFLSKSYRSIENLVRLLSNIENIILEYEVFLYDVIEKFISSNKVKGLIQQYQSDKTFRDSIVNYKETMKNKKDVSADTLFAICLVQFDYLNSKYHEISVILKVELACLYIGYFKNMSRTVYWLSEPQMSPDYYVAPFINETNKILFLYKNNLPIVYFTISKGLDYLLNQCFISQISSINQNSINILGVNLLIRNYNKIYTTVNFEENLIKNQLFTTKIEYFPNYIRLLTYEIDVLKKKLKEFFILSSYPTQLIEPILSVKTNINKPFSDEDKKKIIDFILK